MATVLSPSALPDYCPINAVCTCCGLRWAGVKGEGPKGPPGGSSPSGPLTSAAEISFRARGWLCTLERMTFLPQGSCPQRTQGFRAMVPLGVAGENEESGVREWALGGSGVAGARQPARGAGCRTQGCACKESTWWVCGAFIQTLGSLDSGVSEGVTNQRPETGINYANHHLAMGQMTPIV